MKQFLLFCEAKSGIEIETPKWKLPGYKKKV